MSQQAIQMQIEVFELSRIRSSGFEVEYILEHAARYVETLKTVGNTNLKDDAVTIVWHRCPDERMASHGAPVNYVRSKARQCMFAHLRARRIISKL